MIEDVDKIARDLPTVCLHGHIPTATTMALAARVVELLDRVRGLEMDLSEGRSMVNALRFGGSEFRGSKVGLELTAMVAVWAEKHPMAELQVKPTPRAWPGAPQHPEYVYVVARVRLTDPYIWDERGFSHDYDDFEGWFPLDALGQRGEDGS